MAKTTRRKSGAKKTTAAKEQQLLHLVFGGRVKDPRGLEFENLDEIEIVGIFPDFKSARNAWQGAAHRTVDDAMTKYVVVHLHRLLEPDLDDEDHDHHGD